MIAKKLEHFTLSSMLEASVLLYLQGVIIMNPTFEKKSKSGSLWNAAKVVYQIINGVETKVSMPEPSIYNWGSKLKISGNTFPESAS